MLSIPAFGHVGCETLDQGHPCDGQQCVWNTQCHFTCTDGYSVQPGERSYLICMEDGQWDAQPTACEGKCMEDGQWGQWDTATGLEGKLCTYRLLMITYTGSKWLLI